MIEPNLKTVYLLLLVSYSANGHGTCAIGSFDEYTQWIGSDGVIKFPVSQYEIEFKDNVNMHFYSPDQFMDDYLMLHSCPGYDSNDHTQENITSGCNHCATTKVYSCYGSELTSISLPYNLIQRTPLTAFRMTFVNVTTLKQYGFFGIDTRHIKIQFGGVTLIEPGAFQGIYNLNTLSISRNELSDLGRLEDVFAGLENLTALYLDHNGIKTWDATTRQDRQGPLLPSLETLSLDGNPLDNLNATSFQWLTGSPLKYLNLRECRLRAWTPNVLTPVKNTLEFLDLGSASVNVFALRNLLFSLNPGGNRTESCLRGLSLANIGLTSIPAMEMGPITESLQYLSLYGNAFESISNINHVNKDNCEPEPGRHRERTTSFPPMPELIELDLQNCQLKAIKHSAFEMLPKLEYLILGHNELSSFEESSFHNLKRLRYLDLSSNRQDPFSPPLFGYIYEPQSLHLEDLVSLEVLDFSESKITHLMQNAFAGLEKSLKNLSFCHVGIESVEYGVFENFTSLELLDLAGNNKLMTKFTSDLFKGLTNLQHLDISDCNIDFKRQLYTGASFNHSSPSDDPLEHFLNLKILNLTDNNIKYLSDVAFQSLINIEVIDLGMNRVLSWTTPVFEKNKKLKYVNLKRNRVSFMTETMLREFAKLEKLDLSENPFLCDCYITPFLKLASNYNHTRGVIGPEINAERHYRSPVITEDGDTIYPTRYEEHKRHISNTLLLRDSIANDVTDFIQENVNGNPELSDILNIDQINAFKTFLEIDVSDLKNNTVFIVDIEHEASYSCLETHESRYVSFISTNETYCKDELDESEKQFDYYYDPTVAIAVTMCVSLFIGICLFVIYRQRWHLRFFALQIKNAAVMSFLGRKREEITDTIFNYDVFVSYSDVNRNWILNHLLPNLEKSNDLKVCLHERDFQVGVSILENIIASMDRSRCILLVVSLSFVKSQWCQFELHLAQHRLLETRRDELILVLLEDIPKSKRPKMLHYLMLTKTYIVWPKDEDDVEAKKVFWKRLRKAVAPIGQSSVSIA